ncbi:serine/threonine-protein kinase 33 isoform X2 [Sparus aurata]|uniref:serine/threonine-protein kinase 33 isoform X2 n=1 Tax=Sparus aurata TaxID=8175 RepID=UPI0011C1CBAF|nr:serine/threonine-protein kinase 33 isoform X2 [Sparus aurata]
MTQADVSGFGMSMVSPRTSRDTQERNAPLIRLNDVADLRAGSSKVKMLGQEINILRQVNHAHIIHLQEVYDTPKMTYLVTELCVGGELKQLLRQKKFFTEDETRHVISSLADAVVYLHKRDIVHRDLKLENILVKNSLDEDDNGKINIKVTDFGLSVQTGGVGIGNMMTEACGTLIYMAPEMMSGGGYSQWCDVWSIGVVMYMLLCGESPFVSKTKENLLEEIMNKEVKFTQSIWATISDAAKNVLTCLLKVDPAYRMSPNQLLENPWITGATNVPAIPSNVLEMMRHHLEQEKRGETLEDLSLTSFDDTLEPPPVPGAASTVTASNCSSEVKLIPKKDSSFSAPATSTKQAHAGLKPSTQPTAKQRRPWDKKDVSTGQKPASDNRKAGNQRPSTSSKSRTVPRKPAAGSSTSAALD